MDATTQNLFALDPCRRNSARRSPCHDEERRAVVAQLTAIEVAVDRHILEASEGEQVLELEAMEPPHRE